MPVYMGFCAHCNCGKDHSNFTSCRSGRRVPAHVSHAALPFYKVSENPRYEPSNDRICQSCYDLFRPRNSRSSLSMLALVTSGARSDVSSTVDPLPQLDRSLTSSLPLLSHSMAGNQSQSLVSTQAPGSENRVDYDFANVLASMNSTAVDRSMRSSSTPILQSTAVSHSSIALVKSTAISTDRSHSHLSQSFSVPVDESNMVSICVAAESSRRPLVDITSTVFAESNRSRTAPSSQLLLTSCQLNRTVASSKPKRMRRRLSTPIGKKLSVVRSLATAVDSTARSQILNATGFTQRDVCNFTNVLDEYMAIDPTKRPALITRRLPGGGRNPDLTVDQESAIKKWVIDQRRCPLQLQVTRKDIKRFAAGTYSITASDCWLNGFLKRNGLTLRLRTTSKEVTTPKMCSIANEYRRRLVPLLSLHPRSLLLNMDESPIFLDCPANRTIDEVGAETVEIGSTKHEKDRVTAVLCVTAAGDKLDPLVIHRVHEKTTFVRTNQIFRATVRVVDAERGTDRDVTVWYSFSYTAYMNQTIMSKWIRLVYQPHASSIRSTPGFAPILIMDNMGAHDAPAVKEEFARARIQHRFFPPNQTPNLQPLDHSINASFKVHYEKEWARWFSAAESRPKTTQGNHKRASVSDVNNWVANSWARINDSQVRRCWNHTLFRKPSLHTFPAHLYQHIVSFVDSTDPAMTVALVDLARLRHLHDGQRIPIPVAQNRGSDKAKASERANATDFNVYVESGRKIFPLEPPSESLTEQQQSMQHSCDPSPSIDRPSEPVSNLLDSPSESNMQQSTAGQRRARSKRAVSERNKCKKKRESK